MPAPKQTDPQFKLRMTPDIKEAIEKSAAANNRSMNAEILARLEASFAPPAISAEEVDAVAERVVKRILASGDPTFVSALRTVNPPRRDPPRNDPPTPGKPAIDVRDK